MFMFPVVLATKSRGMSVGRMRQETTAEVFRAADNDEIPDRTSADVRSTRLAGVLPEVIQMRMLGRFFVVDEVASIRSRLSEFLVTTSVKSRRLGTARDRKWSSWVAWTLL